jgi:hypothetical protein
MNMRVTKTFGFGRDLGSSKSSSSSQTQGGGPPPGGGGRGGGGGGPRGGPGGGGPFGGSSSSGRRYTLSFGVVANNIFNDVDRGTPVGVVPSSQADVAKSQFYQSTQLEGGIYSSISAVRRISLVASFSF